MAKGNQSDKNRDLINRQAAEWLTKRQQGFSAKEQDEFFIWLAQDERHSARYAAHSRTWKRLDQLAQWRTEHSEAPNEDLLQAKPKKQYWPIWLGGIAALIVFGLFGIYEFKSDHVSENQSLIAKGYERHRLPDGSYVDMNKGSALKIEYSKNERRLELVANEAHFEVVKDAERPFIVLVRGVEVVAVGTAFNVRINDRNVEVFVTEGRVRLSSTLELRNDIEQLDVVAGVEFQQDLYAGQMSVISTVFSEVPLVIKDASIGEVSRIIDWRRSLEFDSVPLSEVVAEFNRHNDVELVIDDSRLAVLPIVASFRSNSSEEFIELLEFMMDVEVTREEGRIILRLGDAQ